MCYYAYMLTFIVIILISFVLLPTNNLAIAKAAQNSIYFARVLTNDCYLYKTPYNLDGYDNLYFIIPQTYFVQLTGEDGDYFSATYLNFNGYVKKSCVRSIIGSPRTPYNNSATVRVYSTQSQVIHEKPHSSSKQVTTIPLYENVKYIGSVYGEEMVYERTNVWYYCCYTLDKEYYGYIYSDFCDQETGFVDNAEMVDYTEFPNFNLPTANISPAQKFNKKATGIIVAVLMVPALIFVFLCVKGSKLLTKEKSKSKEVKDY